MYIPTEHDHRLIHARLLFPSSEIAVTYGEDEIIHIDVSETRFTFEISSEDDCYFFSDGQTSLEIPLMAITGKA